MSEKYNGLFIRDTLNDKGMIPSVDGAPTYSPDIICFQNSPLSVQDAMISYNRYICKSFLQDDYNNIYVRVKNNADDAIAGKVRAFYAPINLLYTPKFWKPISDVGGNTDLNVVSQSGSQIVDKVDGGGIGLSERAFYLERVETPDVHHCMMGIVSNVDGSFLELPEKFNGDNDLWEFLRNHPQIAYNNITIVKPEHRTFSTPVQYGNHDETSRKYILNIEVMDGLDTLVGSQIIAQSTSARNPFSYQSTIAGGTSSYSCEYTVEGRFYDYMNFAVVMPNYEKVKASLHVKNYVVCQSGDIMVPNVAVDYAEEVADNSGNEQTATQMGDFFLYLGEGLDKVVPDVSGKRRTLELPRLRVTQRF